MAESGIRVRLRSVWSDPWEFESPRAHQIILASVIWWARERQLLAFCGRLEQRNDIFSVEKISELVPRPR